MTPSDAMRLSRFDSFYAVFNPKRLDDLKPEAQKFIGMSAKWTAAWRITDGDYKGHWACMVATTDPWNLLELPFAWVPDSDLDLLKWGV